MKNDVKPAKPFSEQVEILRSKGLILDIDPYSILMKHNYYRLSGFDFHLMTKGENGNQDKFFDGVKFTDIMLIYEFDHHLRQLLQQILSNIEIFFRTYFAYVVAMRLGPEEHMNPSNFISSSQGLSNKQKVEELRDFYNIKTMPFIAHHITNKSSHFPVWVDVEIMNFNLLTKFIKNLKEPEQKLLNKHFVQVEPKNLCVWLDNLVKLRNHCAHHNRLFNQRFDDLPLYGLYEEDICSNSLFARIIVIRDMLQDDEHWKDFKTNFVYLISQYDSKVDMSYIGLPQNWKALLELSYKPYSIKTKIDLQM